MAGFTFDYFTLVSELANLGNYAKNLSQVKALGFHVFNVKDLGFLFVCFCLQYHVLVVWDPVVCFNLSERSCAEVFLK